MFIYRGESMDVGHVFASKQAARVELAMLDGWTKACKPYQQLATAIKV
jgi:hypothetical protein